ncbi:hypothetical protein DPMN_129371 [Dreissena polymorpha]|uniref:Cytochrome P450 n=1 Tax=Dreissena polymorpha TaxID=45954 RepID=A0A9D4JY71_DREPO|nr:hypothetical protein DPMN_129371 [Dreissena polymorpha]
MHAFLSDSLGAGTNFTYEKLVKCILYLQEYPDIQKKCRDIVYQVCGNNPVKWSDRAAMLYLEAFLMEVSRMNSEVVGIFAIENQQETSLLGYTIPKNCAIRCYMHSALMDPKYWAEPTLFNPNRHLSDGKLKLNPAYNPFGLGPRMCIAQKEMNYVQFMVFANFLQRYTFEKEDFTGEESFESAAEMFLNCPLPFKTKVTPLTGLDQSEYH